MFTCWQAFQKHTRLGCRYNTPVYFLQSTTFLWCFFFKKKTCPSELYKTKQTKMMIICEFFLYFLFRNGFNINHHNLCPHVCYECHDSWWCHPKGPMFYVAYEMWHLNSIDDVKKYFFVDFYYAMIRRFLFYSLEWISRVSASLLNHTEKFKDNFRALLHTFISFVQFPLFTCVMGSFYYYFFSFLYLLHEYSMFDNTHSFLSFTEGYMESLNYCRGNKTNIVWTENRKYMCCIYSVTNIILSRDLNLSFIFRYFWNLLQIYKACNLLSAHLYSVQWVCCFSLIFVLFVNMKCMFLKC